jgi:DNA-binding transcriptional LysR family regulator
MSQQTVSRLVASLERELDTQLFIRTTRSVGLTEVGRLYYNLFNDLTRQYDERSEQIKLQTHSDNAKRIKIGIQSFLEPTPLINTVDALKKAYPYIDTQVTLLSPSLLLEDFQRNVLDAIIILDRFLPESCSVKKKKLAVFPLYLLVSMNNKDATDSASYQDFLSLPFISDSLAGEDSLAHRARMKHDIERWNLTPESIIWAYDLSAAVTYAELGDGFIIDSNLGAITSGRKLKAYETGFSESINVLYKEDNLNHTAITVFIRKLVEAYL